MAFSVENNGFRELSTLAVDRHWNCWHWLWFWHGKTKESLNNLREAIGILKRLFVLSLQSTNLQFTTTVIVEKLVAHITLPSFQNVFECGNLRCRSFDLYTLVAIPRAAKNSNAPVFETIIGNVDRLLVLNALILHCVCNDTSIPKKKPAHEHVSMMEKQFPQGSLAHTHRSCKHCMTHKEPKLSWKSFCETMVRWTNWISMVFFLKFLKFAVFKPSSLHSTLQSKVTCEDGKHCFWRFRWKSAVAKKKTYHLKCVAKFRG